MKAAYWMIALAILLGFGHGTMLWAQATSSGQTSSAYDFAPVTSFIEQAYRKAELPGAALLVCKDGQIVYEKFFGQYDESTEVPIASSSKWLSAAVIMTLVDEGKLDLDAPVSKYLPNFAGKVGTITMRQMYSHTSGIVDFPGEWDYTITIADYANKVASEPVFRSEPGTEIRYACASMQVGGRVAEVVSGQGWNTLVKERLTDPCEMPHTRYARTELNRNPLLAGGAFSTLRDYGHFLEMISNRGVYRGKRVLSENAVREMQRDQTKSAPLVVASNDRLGRKSHYGLGEWLDVQDDRGNTLQISSPGAFGFRPWINHPRNLYGVWMVQHPRRQGAAANAARPNTALAYDAWELIDLVHRVIDDGSQAGKAESRP